LGAKLGVGLAAGVAGHFTNGVAIAIIFAALRPSLFGPNWFRGLSFATVQTVMNVWLLLYPLLGMGIAGLEAGYAPAVISILRHYAFILPAIFILKGNTAETAERSKLASTAGLTTVSTLLVAVTLILSGQDANASATDSQVRHRTVEVDGVDIFYREAGTPGNPTILLLHGFPTSSQMFRNLLRDLGDEYYLVAPDYPGFGNSEQPPMDEFEYSFDNLAELVESFTEELQL
jgi:hypothetical protein